MSVEQLIVEISDRGIELWVEGARLRFRGPRGALSAEERAQLSKQRGQVIAALRQRDAARVHMAPLSHNQRSLWFVAQEAPDSPAYNLAVASRFRSAVDVTALADAAQGLTDRHPTLRTTYHLSDDALPEQRTPGSIPVTLERHEAHGLSDDELRQRVTADAQRPFDLECGPVFRISLWSRAPDDHVMVLAVHHIAADAWSLAILADDFRQLYAEASGGSDAVPRRAEQTYADFVTWQAQLLSSAEGERLAGYWRARLTPACPPLDLPTDRPRPSRKSFRGATVATTARPGLLDAVRALARDLTTTSYVVLLAAFDAMLFRLTGSEDLIVGTPTAGRSQAEFNGVVGYFVNPVPLRSRVRQYTTFRELVASVKQTVHDALDNQDYPLPLMVQGAQTTRDASRSPLFDVFFSAVNVDQIRASSATSDPPPTTPDALRAEAYPLHQLEGQFDLVLQNTEREGTLDVDLRYSRDLFDASTAEGFLAHFIALLEAAVQNADTPLEALAAKTSARAHDASLQALIADLAARDVRMKLDGDNLRLNAPAGVLSDDLKARLKTSKAALIEHLRATAGGAGALVRADPAAPLPISFAQQRLWFFDRMQPGTGHYNIALILRVRGSLDQQALIRSLDALLSRHESLRVRLHDDEGKVRAEIADDVPQRVDLLTLSASDPTARRAEAVAGLQQRGQQPFDLSRGPLARFALARLSDDEHLLLLCMHHIAADGWSLSIAAREIGIVYEAALLGKPSPLPALGLKYVDFAAWQHEQLRSGLFARQLGYWLRELAGAPAVLELPTDRPRPAVQSFRGQRISLRMPPGQLEALKAFSRSHGVTTYMTLLAGWQVVLYRYSGQEDVLVGSPFANRDRPEFEALIGCFVNNVVMRGRFAGNPRLSEYLHQVKATVLRAFDHRDLPFDRLVEALRPERSTSHNPIFQVLFTLHSFPAEALRPTGLEIDIVDLGESTGSSRFDLTLEMDEHEGGLRMSYEYVSDLFDRTTIERMHRQYLTLLDQMLSNLDQTVQDVALLTPNDAAELLQRLNATESEHDRGRCLQDLVGEAARQHPEKVAVEGSGQRVTYRELERRANQLAHLLRASGVTVGSLVGVCMDRTVELPIALLAVLKAGAAYVPVDATHPAERLAYTLSDAQVACVVAEAKYREQVAGANVPLIHLDPQLLAAQPATAPDVGVEPSDLAYVIYTSGSTGRPKGVEIEHRQLVNFLHGMAAEPGLAASDVLVAVTTPSFDIAGLELFLPLSVGATTVIASRADVLDGERLSELLERYAATMMQATPATWRLLLDSGWSGKSDLTALCGGEAMPRALAKDLVNRVRALWNMYGPTETTVWSTLQRVDDCERDISIGHPIANTNVYVLDSAGRQAPIGIAGELCIGGEGVARGYRNRPELTQDKFVTLDLGLASRPPERVYRTGDVVRVRADLALEFVGRRDHQVKLRGYRIELGEIETVLTEQPSVLRCVVIVREDSPGDQRLVAYVVPNGEAELPAEELRSALRARLPEYMVPSVITPLEALPLTPNGKVDRKALPVPQMSRAALAEIDSVMTAEQRRVAAIWKAVLHLERVGVHDNFFDLGGHSLLVIKVHALLRREFAADLTIVDLFQRTTVAAQAELLSEKDGTRDAGLERARARAARQGAA